MISCMIVVEIRTRSIEMHRIKCDLVESRNKSKLLKQYAFPLIINKEKKINVWKYY